MREKNRNPIEKCRKKLPQFTTMNVIDGQAGLVNYSSLIFYSLTIDNILNIIVLLILAGVTISTLTGENGILTRASEAREKTGVSSEEEAITIAYTGALAEKNGENNITKDDLNEQFSDNNTKAEAVTNSRIHFTDSDRWYRIDNKGNVSGPYTSEAEIGKVLVEMFENAQADNCEGGTSCTQTEERKHLHIGDYVDLKSVIHKELEENPISITATAYATDTGVDARTADTRLVDIISEIGDQTYTLESGKNELNWRVLGIENGQIKLIAGSPLESNNTVRGTKAPYLFMYGAKAYLTGYKEPNKICETLYKDFSYVDTARSVNINDINEITGITTEEDIHNVNLFEHMSTQGLVYLKYGEAYSFSNQYTPESWLKGETTTVSGKVDGFLYGINATALPVTAKIDNENIFEMLCNNTESKNGASYWLASRSCVAYTATDGSFFSEALFGPGMVLTDGGMTGSGNTSTMFDSNGNDFEWWAAVRPVIILESGVTIDDIPVLSEEENPIEEPTWNYVF